jgi:uncharacterized protein
MKFLITGGTGFIGRNLIKHLEKNNHEYIILSRNKSNQKQIINNLNEIKEEEKIDYIINLAGSKIDQIWNKANKEEIINSRINATKKIVNLIERLKTKPKLLISGSAIGYYDNESQEELDESSPQGKGFASKVCKEWEEEAKKTSIRLCIIRLGVVLGKNEGFLKKIILPFKLCLGGILGTGKQFFSWIHIKDVIRGIMHIIENEKSEGIYNLVSEEKITNKTFTKTLGKIIKRPTFFKVPSLIIKLIFKEMGEELILKGSQINAKKLKEEGFKFEYKTIKSALNDIFN